MDHPPESQSSDTARTAHAELELPEQSDEDVGCSTHPKPPNEYFLYLLSEENKDKLLKVALGDRAKSEAGGAKLKESLFCLDMRLAAWFGR